MHPFSSRLSTFVSVVAALALALGNLGMAAGPQNKVAAANSFTDIGAALPDLYRSSNSTAWGDYNNDGRLDILLTGEDAGDNIVSKVFRNDGGGVFTDIGVDLSGRYYWDGNYSWGDYNNDGKLDILAPGGIYRNDGNDIFTDIGVNLLGEWGGALAWGDYNNDGRLDILANGDDEWDPEPVYYGFVHIYRNDGNGVFTDTGPLAWNFGGPPTARWLDYDNDGNLDFQVEQKIFHNDGNGNFSDLGVALPQGIRSWGDYNNDGKLDILALSSGQLRIFGNDGNGIFTDIGASLGSASETSAWGDYDNDGAPDILVTGEVGYTSLVAKVYRNNGNETFTDISANLTGVWQGSAIWGDYDNDGKLDILLAGLADTEGYTKVTRVYHNNASAANTAPSAPAGLSSLTSDRNVTLSWTAASDAETPSSGLTYNLRVGTTPGGVDVVAPDAAADGYRRVPQTGNVEHSLTKTLKNLPYGTYYWSVQAVDPAWAGSPFAGEQSFTLVPVPVDSLNLTGPDWNYPATDTSFSLTAHPSNASQPIDYTWEATGLDTLTHPGRGLTDTAVFNWPTTGEKVVTVTASNEAGTISESHTINVTNIAITGLTISGPEWTYSAVDTPYTATAMPSTASQPVDYTWEASGLPTVMHTGRGLNDTVTFEWPAGTEGLKVISVTATNVAGSLTSTFPLVIQSPSADPYDLVVDTTLDSNAAAYQVCSNAVSKDCSLRGAISKANADGVHAYTLELPAGVYTLTLNGSEDANATGDLDISGNLTLLGAGKDHTSINGNQLDRVMDVQSGAVAVIENVTITGGLAVGQTTSLAGKGGGIYNAGNLTLKNTTMAGNIAAGKAGSPGTDGASHWGDSCPLPGGNNGGNGGPGSSGGEGRGGGLFNAGILNADNLILDQNIARGGGGGNGGFGGYGAWAWPGHCAGGNGGTGGEGGTGGNAGGGGLYNTGSATLANSTISGNAARGGFGGAGHDGGVGGSVNDHSSYSGYGGAGGDGGYGNYGLGGGLYNSGQLSLTFTSLTGNIVHNGSGGDGGEGGEGGAVGGNGGGGGNASGFGGGGGIYNDGSINLNASIITGNVAGDGGLGGNGGDANNRITGGGVTFYRGGDGGSGGDGGNGGSILNENSNLSYPSTPVSLSNTIIGGNTGGAGAAGGTHGTGLFPSDGQAGDNGHGSGMYISNSEFDLVHVTLASNTGGDGSGIYAGNSTSLGLTNSILVGHTVGIVVYNSSVTLESTLWGSGEWANGTDWQGSVTHANDYTGNPTFIDSAGGDYHIGAGSAAIDKGIETVAAVDIDNQPRPNSDTGIPDLGADEYWVLVPLSVVEIDGPTSGNTGHTMDFTANFTPSDATPNITYIWSPQPVSGQNTPTATYSWSSLGTKIITVLARNAGGSVTASHSVTLQDTWHIYLPLVLRQ